MRLQALLTFVMLLVAAPMASAAGPESADLRPKFEVGRVDRFTVDMVSTREAKFVESSTTRPEKYQQTLRVRRRIVEANEKGATIEVVLEAAVVAIDAGNRSIRYDSEGINGSEATLAMGATVDPALGRPVMVRVDAKGRAVSVEGNKDSKVIGSSLSLMGDDMFLRTLGPLYGLNAVVASAKEGDGWKEERSADPNKTGVLTTVKQFTVREVSDGLATLAVTGSISLEPSDMAREAKTKIDEHLVNGRIVWDSGAGMIRSYTYDQSMKLLAETEGHMRMAVTSYSLNVEHIAVWPPVPVGDATMKTDQ